MKTYILSDIHLSFWPDDFEINKQNKLFSWLDSIESPCRIVFLGDLFDFWFEWYHVIPRYHFIFFHKLRKLIDAGSEIHYVTGNHDFHLGKYFTEEVGLICHVDEMELNLDGKKIFLGHGDGYAKDDKGYRILKKIIRHPWSIFMFKTFIPPDLGLRIARFTANSSRKHRNIPRSQWGEEYFNWAKSKFSEGFDFVLLGHIHYPVRREENGKVYVNTGDWQSYRSYAVYENGKLELEYFENPTVNHK